MDSEPIDWKATAQLLGIVIASAAVAVLAWKAVVRNWIASAWMYGYHENRERFKRELTNPRDGLFHEELVGLTAIGKQVGVNGDRLDAAEATIRQQGEAFIRDHKQMSDSLTRALEQQTDALRQIQQDGRRQSEALANLGREVGEIKGFLDARGDYGGPERRKPR